MSITDLKSKTFTDLKSDLIGEKVLVLCRNYIYSGIATAFDSQALFLREASLVFETGSLKDPVFTEAEKLPGLLILFLASIEAIQQTDKR